MNRRTAAAMVGMLFIGLTPVQAQPPQIVKEDVSFKTTDGVLLKGVFYPSKKGGSSPAVLLLHKLGESRTKGDWETLAGKLQEKGYAVLSFDFRGHGASTQVDPAVFWTFQANNTFVKGADSKKKKLEWKDFRVGYIPYLVNDIAAARHDLDNRNDNGQCNTSNLIVIGAEDGASIGMFWILTEFYRPQVYQKLNLLNINAGVINNSPAGDDFAGAIWLSYKRHPGIANTNVTMPYGTWMYKAPNQQTAPIVAVRDRIPMWLAAGAKDANGVNDANYMYNTVLNADNAKVKLELTSKLTVPNTPLRGVNLLGLESLKVDELIDKFIDKAVKIRPNQAQRKRNAGDFLPTWIEPSGFGFGR